MDGLHLLGASTEALSSQYITLRVKSIDRDKIKAKLGGMAAAGLSFVDLGPKAALDIAAPLITSVAKDYGADVEVVVSNVPPSKGGRAVSEFFPGFVVGTALGGSALVLWKLGSALVGRFVRR